MRAEIADLAAIDTLLPEHQALSPVFSSAPLDTLEARIAEWETDFDDPNYTTFVAELDGRVVGAAVGCSLTLSGSHIGLARPDNAGFLGFAAVRPDARGAGAGRALGEAVLSWSIDAGHAAAVTDWRATNLLSSPALAPAGLPQVVLPDAPAGRALRTHSVPNVGADQMAVCTLAPLSYESMIASASSSARRPASAGTGGGRPSMNADSSSSRCRSNVRMEVALLVVEVARLPNLAQPPTSGRRDIVKLAHRVARPTIRPPSAVDLQANGLPR